MVLSERKGGMNLVDVVTCLENERVNVNEKNFREVLFKYCDQAVSQVSSCRGEFERKNKTRKKREIGGRLMFCSLVSRYLELEGCVCARLLVVAESVKGGGVRTDFLYCDSCLL